VRQKRDQLAFKNNELQSALDQQNERAATMEVFAKKENVEAYQQIIQNVRETLTFFKQEQLLDDIINEPLKEGSGDTFLENSLRLTRDLESLMPLIGKSLAMLILERSKMEEKLTESN